MNKKAGKAWEMFLRYQHSKEATVLLHLIANDCYKVKGTKLVLNVFVIASTLVGVCRWVNFWWHCAPLTFSRRWTRVLSTGRESEAPLPASFRWSLPTMIHCKCHLKKRLRFNNFCLFQLPCRDHLYETIKILRTSSNPQANQMINIMKNWNKEQ